MNAGWIVESSSNGLSDTMSVTGCTESAVRELSTSELVASSVYVGPLRMTLLSAAGAIFPLAL